MKVSINEATLESHVHEVNAIKSGVKLFKAGKVTWGYDEELGYIANVDDKYATRRPMIEFTRDGLDIKKTYCQCSVSDAGRVLCKHIVAGILAIQDGFPDSKIVLEASHQVSVVVDETNTALAMKSGVLPVFATPAMVALMEQAASKLLDDCIDEHQTSVGTLVNIEHFAASPIGALITATATIDYVFGRKIKFSVTASDGKNEIGKGKHTRMIVDADKFMSKVKV